MQPKIKMAENIVNLTETTVRMYDDATGEIKELLPDHGRLRPVVTNDDNEPQVYYIIQSEKVAEIRGAGRRLDDLAVVRDTGVGRDGIVVTFLASAENRNKLVRLRNAQELVAIA